MAQFVFDDNNLNKLINFIDGRSLINDQMNLQLIDSHFIDDIAKIIAIPKVLLEIVNSYLQIQIQIHVTKYNINNYQYIEKQQHHAHFKFIISNDFLNIKFALVYCFYFFREWDIRSEGISIAKSVYDTFSHCCADDDTFERKLFVHRNEQNFVKDIKNKYDAERLIFLTNAFVNPDKYFTIDKISLNDKYHDIKNPHCGDVLNDNIFFNCYSKNTHQNHNMIRNNFQNINDDKYFNHVELCKYDENSNNYNYIFVRQYTTKMVKYKVKNHKKMSCIIAINKLLYDIIHARTTIKEKKY